MRHQYLCIASILASALLGEAVLSHADAGRLPSTRESSPVLVINMRSYSWKLPEFRMAGNDAYVIVQVQNPHDYDMRMFVSCRNRQGRIAEMSGYHTIGPMEYLRMDTRRLRNGRLKGEGMRVRCRFRSDSSAKVEAWVYDDESRKARTPRGNGSPISG